MNIGIDAFQIHGKSGIETYTRSLIEAMGQIDAPPSVHLFCWNKKKHINRLRALYPRSTRYAIRPVSFASSFLSESPNTMLNAVASKILQRSAAGVDIYHRCDPFARFFHIPGSVITIHDLFPITHAGGFEQHLSTKYSQLLPALQKNTSQIIVPTQYIQSQVLHYMPAMQGRVHTVYEAASEKFTPTVLSEKTRHDLGIADLSSYVLFIGRVDYRKNTARLVAAHRMLAPGQRERFPLLLVLNGKDEQVANFARQNSISAGDPSIRIVRSVSDAELVELYSSCGIFAFPSLDEGFGLPLLEAMQCGAPVLTSSASCMPEVAGNAAHYANPLKPESIADALARMIEDDEYRLLLRRRGLERAQQFSWKKAAEETVGVYREAIAWNTAQKNKHTR